MIIPNIPVIQSTVCLDDIFTWVRTCITDIGYGRVGVEFSIQDGMIVSYRPTIAPNIRPQQIIK